MFYLIASLVVAALGGVAAWFVLRNKDEIVDKIVDVVDDVDEAAAKGIRKASETLASWSDEAKEELYKAKTKD